MDRRALLTALGGGLLAAPIAVEALADDRRRLDFSASADVALTRAELLAPIGGEHSGR
jgi:hypothetical protein